jgi:phage tail-like protein
VLDFAMVSRRHAEVQLTEQGLQLTDLGSTAGTYIGTSTRPIATNDPALLNDGAVFHIRPWTLIFRAARMGEAEVMQPSAQEAATLLPAVVEVPSRGKRPMVPIRPVRPVPPLAEAVSRYLGDLPSIYQQDGGFLGRFLMGFEAFWEPMEERQSRLPMYFDPRTCPAAFLPWLAGWLGLNSERDWTENRQRALLAEAMELYGWRGTHYGIARAIELYTDVAPTIADEPGQPFVIHVRLSLPRTVQLDRRRVVELIEAYKPAYVGYVLEIETAP